MHRLGLTSGTVSVRIDRLVERGVVVREPADEDRRVQLVRLTDEGLRLFDEIAPRHLANEDRLLSALDNDQRNQLAGLLRQLLATFEQPRARLPSLGLELLEAHAARSRRTEVGLSDEPGLLVAAPPDPGSPAAAADLRHGDLLVTIDGEALRSVAALSRLTKSAPSGGRTARVELLRGDTRSTTPLRLPGTTG
jgi:C-terminal processing protease CtpA/Prc